MSGSDRPVLLPSPVYRESPPSLRQLHHHLPHIPRAGVQQVHQRPRSRLKTLHHRFPARQLARLQRRQRLGQKRRQLLHVVRHNKAFQPQPLANRHRQVSRTRHRRVVVCNAPAQRHPPKVAQRIQRGLQLRPARVVKVHMNPLRRTPLQVVQRRAIQIAERVIHLQFLAQVLDLRRGARACHHPAPVQPRQLAGRAAHRARPR